MERVVVASRFERVAGALHQVGPASADGESRSPGRRATALCDDGSAGDANRTCGERDVSALPSSDSGRVDTALRSDRATGDDNVILLVERGTHAAADAGRLIAALRDDGAAFDCDLSGWRDTARRADASRVLAANRGERALALNRQRRVFRHLDAGRILVCTGENIVSRERHRAGGVGNEERRTVFRFGCDERELRERDGVRRVVGDNDAYQPAGGHARDINWRLVEIDDAVPVAVPSSAVERDSVHGEFAIDHQIFLVGAVSVLVNGEAEIVPGPVLHDNRRRGFLAGCRREPQSQVAAAVGIDVLESVIVGAHLERHHLVRREADVEIDREYLFRPGIPRHGLYVGFSDIDGAAGDGHRCSGVVAALADDLCQAFRIPGVNRPAGNGNRPACGVVAGADCGSLGTRGRDDAARNLHGDAGGSVVVIGVAGADAGAVVVTADRSDDAARNLHRAVRGTESAADACRRTGNATRGRHCAAADFHREVGTSFAASDASAGVAALCGYRAAGYPDRAANPARAAADAGCIVAARGRHRATADDVGPHPGAVATADAGAIGSAVCRDRAAGDRHRPEAAPLCGSDAGTVRAAIGGDCAAFDVQVSRVRSHGAADAGGVLAAGDVERGAAVANRQGSPVPRNKDGRVARRAIEIALLRDHQHGTFARSHFQWRTRRIEACVDREVGHHDFAVAVRIESERASRVVAGHDIAFPRRMEIDIAGRAVVNPAVACLGGAIHETDAVDGDGAGRRRVGQRPRGVELHVADAEVFVELGAAAAIVVFRASAVFAGEPAVERPAGAGGRRNCGRQCVAEFNRLRLVHAVSVGELQRVFDGGVGVCGGVRRSAAGDRDVVALVEVACRGRTAVAAPAAVAAGDAPVGDAGFPHAASIDGAAATAAAAATRIVVVPSLDDLVGGAATTAAAATATAAARADGVFRTVTGSAAAATAAAARAVGVAPSPMFDADSAVGAGRTAGRAAGAAGGGRGNRTQEVDVAGGAVAATGAVVAADAVVVEVVVRVVPPPRIV